MIFDRFPKSVFSLTLVAGLIVGGCLDAPGQEPVAAKPLHTPRTPATPAPKEITPAPTVAPVRSDSSGHPKVAKPVISTALPTAQVEKPFIERCIASWYNHPRFHGAYAAHKTIPKGTYIIVSHGSKSLKVQVIDRGPYIAGRCIDLTDEAFKHFAPLGAGLLIGITWRYA